MHWELYCYLVYIAAIKCFPSYVKFRYILTDTVLNFLEQTFSRSEREI